MPELISKVLHAHRAQPERTFFATEVLNAGWSTPDLYKLNQVYGRLCGLGLMQETDQIIMPGPGFCTVNFKATADRRPLGTLITLAEDAEPLLRRHIVCDDPALFAFIVDTYQHCILDNIRPPQAPVNHPLIVPGGEYNGQFLWDGAFTIDLLSILPSQRETVRGALRNYWEFQERWKAIKPDYAHGMIQTFVRAGYDDWARYPAHSQIPTLAWGVERAYRRSGDIDMVREAVAPLESFHEWFWRERDVRKLGMIHTGAYNGRLKHARTENWDYEVVMDGMNLTPHPTRKTDAGPDQCWYGDVYLANNTSYLVLSEDALARLAELVADPAMAQRRRARRDRAIAAMRQHMWDEEWGMFLSLRRDTLEKIRIRSIGNFIPLHGGVPTRDMAARMAAALAEPRWQTPVPLATVARDDPYWTDPDCCYVRGDVWPPINFEIALGLARYGFHDLAATVCDQTIANALKHGVAEYYHCDTGKPYGVPYLNMSATMLTMMFDGLTRRYRASVKSSSVAASATTPSPLN